MEERTKKLTTKIWTLHEWKVYFKQKGKVHIMNFSDKRKVVIMEVKGDLFQRKKLAERWIFLSIHKTFMILWEPKNMIFQLSKNNKIVFSLAGNNMFTDYWKVLALNLSEIRSFMSQKVDGKMIFTCFFWAFHGILGLGKYGFSCSVYL